MAFAPSIAMLMIGRLVIGLGVGAASQIVPLYLSEVAPVEIRGKLVAFNVATITLAQLLASCLAYAIRPHWRVMLGLAGVPSLIQLFGMFFMPESPRWLGKVGRDDEQRNVMKLIYKAEYLESANENLSKEIDALKEETKLSEMERLKTLCTTYRRCLIIGCGIQAF